MSETFLVASLLAVSGGFLDAYTYLFRGGVFANGQTGNLVLLGIRAAERDWKRASYYLLPIFSFIIGVLAAEVIRIYVKDDKMIKWRHVILMSEIIILTITLFIPQGDLNQAVNIAVSFVCALQTQSFRSLKGKPYISVMCTGNLRSAAAELSLYGQKRNKMHLKHAWEYVSVVMLFVAGALTGAILTDRFGGRGLVFVIILLCMVLAILFMKKQFVRFCEKYGFSWLEW